MSPADFMRVYLTYSHDCGNAIDHRAVEVFRRFAAIVDPPIFLGVVGDQRNVGSM